MKMLLNSWRRFLGLASPYTNLQM